MDRRFRLDEYPWDRVEETRRFIRRLFTADPPPDRPGAVFHIPPWPETPPPPPAGLTAAEGALWTAVEMFRRRPVGRDDFVPALSTGAGTCAMATAFGCEEIATGSIRWVRPAVGRPEEIDRLRKPRTTDGLLGGILETTRFYAARADERIAVRVMDFQSPFTTAEQILGSDTFFLMPYDHPRRLHALMDLVTDFAIEFFSAQMAAAGPACCPGLWPVIWFPKEAGIQMSDDNLVNVSPEVYDEFVLPYNNRIADAFGGMFLHSCTIRERNLPSLKKIRGLTGVNCDISTSVATARLLEEFGERIVVAPHAYVNTDTNFAGYRAFAENVLEGWRPGRRLFVYPCPVLYLPPVARETPFDEEAFAAPLERIPAWTRDHPRPERSR